MQVRLLREISAFIQKHNAKGFVKLLLMKDKCVAQIDSYYHLIEAFIMAFQVFFYSQF
jgi:hypothetical protein